MQLELSDQEIEFYSRQLLVSGWGSKQQLALKNSIVILSYESELLALYLAGAGVGEIVYEKNVENIKKLNPNIEIKRRINSSKNKSNKTENFKISNDIMPRKCFEIGPENHDSKHILIPIEKNNSPIKTALLTAIKCINIITKQAS